MKREKSEMRFYVQDSLLRMGTIVVDYLVEYFNTHSGREVEGTLKVCVGVPSPQFLDPALSLMKHEKPAVVSIFRASYPARTWNRSKSKRSQANLTLTNPCFP